MIRNFDVLRHGWIGGRIVRRGGDLRVAPYSKDVPSPSKSLLAISSQLQHRDSSPRVYSILYFSSVSKLDHILTEDLVEEALGSQGSGSCRDALHPARPSCVGRAATLRVYLAPSPLHEGVEVMLLLQLLLPPLPLPLLAWKFALHGRRNQLPLDTWHLHMPRRSGSDVGDGSHDTALRCMSLRMDTLYMSFPSRT